MYVQLPLRGNDLARFQMWKKRNETGTEEQFAAACASQTKIPGTTLVQLNDGSFTLSVDKNELQELNRGPGIYNKCEN